MITGNNIEDYIKRDGVYVTKTEGISMLPFIRQGHATVIVVPVRERLKKYDVALFHRKTGEYVLHRVVKVRKNDYVFCGDNQKTWEYGITDELIVGVMSELYDDGVKIDIDGLFLTCMQIKLELECKAGVTAVQRRVGALAFLDALGIFFASVSADKFVSVTVKCSNGNVCGKVNKGCLIGL